MQKRYTISILTAFFISLIFSIPSYSADKKKEAVNIPPEHKHSEAGDIDNHGNKNVKVSNNKILDKRDIEIFLNTFNPIEKELNRLGLTQFNRIDTFKKELKDSKTVADILKKEDISSKQYILIFNSVTSAYNEIKMIQFEERIRKNQHEKFIYREELMLDHKSSKHKALHKMQEDNFKERFDADGLLGSASEPKENIKLVKMYVGMLDKLFKN